MGAIVGTGIRQRMAENGDEPVTHEWYEPTNHGGQVAKAWGRKGLYIASNDSGEWITAGPFEVAA